MNGEIVDIPQYSSENKPCVFVVSDGDNKQRFQYTGFFPVRKGDIISIDGGMEKTNRGTRLILEEKPLVYIPRGEENVVKYLRDALTGGKFKPKKSYSHNLGQELYDEMMHKSGSHEDILHKLDNHVIDYYVTVNDKELQKIYAWWKKTILKRQLYLFGLYNKEIDESGLTLTELVDAIKDNPSKICSLSLERVSEINNLFRRETKDIDLICGGILRKLVEYKKQGWFYLPEKILKKYYPDVKQYKKYLQQEFDVIIENKKYFTKQNYNIEFLVASRISELIRIDKMGENIKRKISFHVYGDKILTKEQIKALKGTLVNMISIITGGAGCGKTTLLREIFDNLENKGRKVVLSSYTGKAVMRIKEIVCQGRSKEIANRIEKNCITLSRLIHKKRTFQKTPEFDTLIIDESSMVPTGLVYQLFTLFPDTFKIILIGDCNQLDPVEPGSFFKELIDTEKIKTFYLTKNMRTGDGSSIVVNASKMVSPDRNFNIPYEFKEGEGLYLMEPGIDTVKSIVKGLWKSGINSKDLTILCPVNKFLPVLSGIFQKYFLRKQDRYEFKDRIYIFGDRMMQNKNFYSEDLELMNGEEGYIVNIEQDFIEISYGKDKKVSYNWEAKKIDIDVDEDDQEIDKLGIDSVINSFAKTIHKSQGSEYEDVIIYIPIRIYQFINVNMLYTAITRAKKRVWIVGEKNTIDLITTRRLPLRHETLGQKLISILD